VLLQGGEQCGEQRLEQGTHRAASLNEPGRPRGRRRGSLRSFRVVCQGSMVYSTY
jgi:hypothetical protein